MDFSIRGVTNAIQQGEHDLAHDITTTLERSGDAASGIARGLVNAARGGLNRLPGHLGNQILGYGRNPKSPRLPADKPAPHPGDIPILSLGGSTVCGNMDKFGGGQPFPLVGYKLLAAGAQTQGTDLFDFHAATSNPTIITTNDLIPGNVEVFEASLYVGVKLLTTLGSENSAFLNSLWLIERVNGIEKARWSLKQLGMTVSHVGLTTSGAAAATEANDLPPIPWHRRYDPNVPHALAVQCSVTTTTVQALEFTFVETGLRP